MLSRATLNLDLQNTPAFVNAKRIDLRATTPHPELTAWIESLADTTQLSLSLRPQEPTEFERALQMLIQNVLRDPQARFFALSKSWADYPRPSRYNRNPLPLSAVIAATEFLASKNWLVIHPGSKQTGLCTRLEPTEDFINVLEREELTRLKLPKTSPDEILLLRNEAKELLDYQDTAKTLTARRSLHQINHFLRQHLVMHGGCRLNTDLVRIFKDSFLEGGRFYRAEHLALSSVERAEITINGEAVAEIDYSCLHVNMLYIKETGSAYQGDAYESERKDIPRDVYKILLQIILNCKTEFAATLAANQALTSRGIHVRAETAIAAFLKKHAAIKKYFFSGVGLRLQFEDSVIAEKVLLKAMQKQVPVLPVHDSFLCPESDREWLRDAMTEASIEVLGARLPFKEKTAAKAA